MLERRGDRLRLYDGDDARARFTWPPVTVDLRHFVRTLVREGEICLRFVERMSREIESRGYGCDELLDLVQQGISNALVLMTSLPTYFAASRASKPDGYLCREVLVRSKLRGHADPLALYALEYGRGAGGLPAQLRMAIVLHEFSRADYFTDVRKVRAQLARLEKNDDL